MTDRELLELAAKAAGIEGRYVSLNEFPDWMAVHNGEGIYCTATEAWNPLTDDGDALRLAVKLDLHIRFYRKHVDVDAEVHGKSVISEQFTEFKDAATRRALVRAAAEIGRAK